MHPIELDALLKLAKARLRAGVAAHTYAAPGDYTIELENIYNDNNEVAFPFASVAHMDVTVDSDTATFNASGPSTATVGQSYLPTLTLGNPHTDETVSQWTLAWGDGTSTVALGTPPTVPNHVYHVPGSFTIVASAVTQYETVTASIGVSVAGPTVGVSQLDGSTGVGAAYEAGQIADEWVFTRSLSDTVPMTVGFALSGSAALGTDYVLTDARTGLILTDSVTIPANATFATVVVTPVDDTVPEWTESITATLTPSSDYAVDSSHEYAQTEIVDNDLGITLGNGSGNIILQGSSDGTQNLVTLVLSFPAAADEGAVLTLTDSADTEADVWTTSTPDPPTDHPILGDDNGTYHSSVAWTYSPSAPSETTFWVGGTDGSTTMDDIAFTLGASDAGASSAPAHPTTNSTTTRGATDFTIKIISKNNPNDTGNPPSLDATDNSIARPWVVGQVVDLQAVFAGPAFRTEPTFQWTVPGNVLYNYTDDNTRAVATPLLPNNNLFDPLYGVGTQKSEVQFFWVTNDPPSLGPEENVVTLTITSLFVGVLSATSTFDVYSPTVTAAVSSESPTVTAPIASDLWYVGLGPLAGPSDGIAIGAYVAMPTGITGTGSWKFVQTIQTGEYATLVEQSDSSVQFSAHMATNAYGVMLDTRDPAYGLYDTGSSATFVDSPATVLTYVIAVHNTLGQITTNVTTLSFDDRFDTYIMYLPPGASRWVVTGVIGWTWSVRLHRAGHVYLIDAATGPSPTDFETSVSQPVWTKNVWPEGNWHQD